MNELFKKDFWNHRLGAWNSGAKKTSRRYFLQTEIQALFSQKE